MYIKKLFFTLFIVLMIVSCDGGNTNNTTNSNNNTSKSNNTDENNKTDTTKVNNTTKIEDNLLLTNKDINISLNNPLYKSFGVGFGSAGAFGFENKKDGSKPIWVSSIDLIIDDNIEDSKYYADIVNFDSGAFDVLQQKLKSTKYVVYWLTKSWKESWFSVKTIQKGMDKGIVPVFMYWYFGDELSGGFPSDTKLDKYKLDNVKFSNFLHQLKGQKIVIMEPEFNKNVIIEKIENQHKFASVISDAIDRIDSNSSNILYSLCMTDKGRRDINSEFTKNCGYDNCSLGDVSKWKQSEIVYQDLLDKNKLDFISFKEMLAQFSRDPSRSSGWSTIIPIKYTDNEMGIEFLASRIVNFAKYLRNKYKKPVFMPYIGIGTATWDDINNNNKIEVSEIDYTGWESQANNVYVKLMSKKEELLKNNFFGFGTMSLFDNPQNDKNGYKFFLENEYHLGVIKTSAKDSKIKDNSLDIYLLGDITPKLNIIDTIFN